MLTTAQKDIALRWSRGEISSGKAGPALGMTRIEFLDLVAKHNREAPEGEVVTWPYTREDLEDDIRFSREK